MLAPQQDQQLLPKCCKPLFPKWLLAFCNMLEQAGAQVE